MSVTVCTVTVAKRYVPVSYEHDGTTFNAVNERSTVGYLSNSGVSASCYSFERHSITDAARELAWLRLVS